MNYKDYYPPAKLRTLLSLLEVYKNNNNNSIDEAKRKLFGSRSALAEELGEYHFDSKNDQTLANKIDDLVIDVSNKSDEYLEKLWFEQKEYAQLWWSLVYFVNTFPLRPPKEGDEDIMLKEVNPEELLVRIDKQVIPAVKIMLVIVKDMNELQTMNFCRNAINTPDISLKQYEKEGRKSEDIQQLIDLRNEGYQLYDEGNPLYYLALSICTVKKLKLARKNGIDIDEVYERMQEVDLLSVIYGNNVEQKKNTREKLKKWLPNIKTTWHACAMLALIIYTQQLIKGKFNQN